MNVWLALAAPRHSHSAAATTWFDLCDEDTLVFCRVSQMGLLRLLTNPKVLGVDVLSPGQAWNTFDRFMEDERVVLLPEPPELQRFWRSSTRRRQTVTNFWTDAYMAAFAEATGCTVVTFDRGFQQWKAPVVHLKTAP